MNYLKLSALLLFAVTLCSCVSAKHETFVVPKSFQYPEVSVAAKDFVTKGFVFVESKLIVNEKGERIGSEITNEMLIKEAQKLGADAVVNVKIDVFEENKSSVNQGKTTQERTYIYKASGLAIKYTNAVDTGVQK
ncbi:MAG: hypothetical protein FWF00_00730 [Endomicrobia bacterium]|nr:hypothetical protein [Endomicrobiia bacterium]MCL2506201.1 hypothetical protein [Endomicrobiia bacterium]